MILDDPVSGIRAVNLLSFSGGKDSAALYLHALERDIPFRAVFADTGNEHPLTYEYVRNFARQAGGPAIEWVKAEFTEDDFVHRRNYVTEHWPEVLTKDQPGFWRLDEGYQALDQGGDDSTADEGTEPLLVHPDGSTTPFPEVPGEPESVYQATKSGPYVWVPAKRGFTQKQAQDVIDRVVAALQRTGNPFLDLCVLKGRFPSTRARFCSERLKHEPIFYRIVEPLLEQDIQVFSWQGVRAEESPSRAKLARIEEVGGGLWNYRPILTWKVDEVFALIKRHGVAPNPLYKLGAGRVGCMPCIHSKKDEIRNISLRFPEVIDRIEQWEHRVAMASKLGIPTFFAADTTPGTEDTRSRIRNVVEWSKTARGGRQYSIFGDDAPMCSSIYGLCE